MKYFTSFSILASICALCVLAADSDNRGQYNPGPSYDGRYRNRDYYNTRDYYNQRYYHDNLLKQYKSDILAKDSRIIEQKLEPAIDGNFAYEFDTENGIHADAHGTNVRVGNDEGQKIEGSFAYITPEGLQVSVRYTADENGYRPVYTFGGVEAVRYSNSPASADVAVAKSN